MELSEMKTVSISDLKEMNEQQMAELAVKIRKDLIENVSKTGGHLASNLGVVELTIALHKVFDTPKDKIIWDVGHQAYVHKMLTGRWDKMDTNRMHGGISGFPKITESEHDMYSSGHSGTSISAAMGYACARDLAGDDYSCVAVIGDGALTGGVAFEALNSAGSAEVPLIVVLNDNEMSIGENIGGMAKHLQKIRTTKGYLNLKKSLKKASRSNPGKKSRLERLRDRIKYAIMPGLIFEELGFKYFGPIDGHDISSLVQMFSAAREMKKPVLIHIVTKKGKGFAPAEENPEKYHGVNPFDIAAANAETVRNPKAWSNVFGAALTKEAENNPKIVAVHAAMEEGTGLSIMKEAFPERVFDCGIAEQHAASFSAGLALNGYKPVLALYSTFLQRAYDQVITEICLMNLPVVIGVDRAGVTGKDGETHQGVFDISFLYTMPNMTVFSPADSSQLKEMLSEALEMNTPCAIRYPRGSAPESSFEYKTNSFASMAILSDGPSLGIANQAAKILDEKGLHTDVIQMKVLKPLDEKVLSRVFEKYRYVITLEDGIADGGFGSRIAGRRKAPKTLVLGWPDKFIEHGTPEELREIYGLDPKSVVEKAVKFIEN